jgi:hypothetical protein
VCQRDRHKRSPTLSGLENSSSSTLNDGTYIRDFDPSRPQLTVFGKDQKERVIPLHGRIAMALNGVPRRAARCSIHAVGTTNL